MRIIYVNGEKTRIEEGCGIRPLKKCPVISYAESNGYTVKCDRTHPIDPHIKIDSVQDVEKVCADIQIVCDECKFSTCHFVRERSK